MKRKIIDCVLKQTKLLEKPFFRRWLWNRGGLYRSLRCRAADMRRKKQITVAFMVMNLPCWKCDSVLRLMLQHPRFRPIIWLVPELQIADAEERLRNDAMMKDFFRQRGYPVAVHYSLEQMREEYAPDIVFLAKPYYGCTICDAAEMDKELVCYVPYGYQNTLKDDYLYGPENYVWRNFYATRGIRRLASSLMQNGGWNVRVTGLPAADAYLFPEAEAPDCKPWKALRPGMRKVIWAPHWTVSGDSFFTVSTFLAVAEGMLQLAEKYADQIQWAFKPHPLLRDSLYQHPDWGKERTDAYYERWATMPNTQLESGAYVELFKQSDAMVHDSGSFIMEYLLVDKPCMYLQAGKGFSDFNADTLAALECYHKGASVADVEQFLLRLLRGTPDTMACARARYKKHYLMPPGNRPAARNIIDAILSGR